MPESRHHVHQQVSGLELRLRVAINIRILRSTRALRRLYSIGDGAPNHFDWRRRRLVSSRRDSHDIFSKPEPAPQYHMLSELYVVVQQTAQFTKSHFLF